MNLFGGLIDRVLHFLKIYFADYVETVVGCHRGSIKLVLSSQFSVLSSSSQLWAVCGCREEGLEVGGGLSGEEFARDAAEFGEGGGGVGDEGRLVALAAEGNGGEERGVGFDQDAVGGCEGGGFADGLGGGIGEVAGEGEIEAEGERAAGFVDAAGEAVHDAGERVGLPVLGEQAEEVFPGGVWIRGAEFLFGGGRGELGGSAVDEDGLAGVGGDAELGEESGLLDVGSWVFDMVVVEADFADGEATRVGGEGG